MQAIMHSRVRDEFPDQIVPGTALYVTQVSIFMPTLRSVYLNIVPANIRQVFVNINFGPASSQDEKSLSQVSVL